jgi:hypothetical protein
MATKPVPVTAQNQTYKWLTQFMDRVFEPESRRMQQALDRIVEMHEEILPPEQRGWLCFRYGGDVFAHSRTITVNKAAANLAWALNDQMDKWLKETRELRLDKDQIQQTLFKCLHGWNDRQDFRNRMPECLVTVTGSNLERTVPFEEATCHLTPRDRRQFEKILPKIQLYATTRLIY